MWPLVEGGRSLCSGREDTNQVDDFPGEGVGLVGGGGGKKRGPFLYASQLLFFKWQAQLL